MTAVPDDVQMIDLGEAEPIDRIDRRLPDWGYSQGVEADDGPRHG